MANNIQKTASSGFPFMSILTLIFITLKLCNVITWSWWWVLAPLWGPLAIVMVIAVIALITLFIGVLVRKKR